MKQLLAIALIPMIYAGSVFAGCDTETVLEGPAMVLECAAKLHVPPMTAETLWNQLLFKSATQDGYCKGDTAKTSHTEKTQKTIAAEACAAEKGTYASYANFIAADQAIASRLGSRYSFLRDGQKGAASFTSKLQELSNFLATAAQETKGANGTTDGLAFRYEVNQLQSNTWGENPQGNCVSPPANPDYTDRAQAKWTANCASLGPDQFITGYYPLSAYIVAVKPKADSKAPVLPALVNTTLVVYSDRQYNTQNDQITVVGRPDGPAIGGTYPPPAGAKWEYMNQVIKPAYWIGVGPIQLTEDSMLKFFGWYYQNMDGSSADHTYEDPQAFIERVMKEGKLGFMGALWYWNFRIQELGGHSIHCMLSKSPLEACHDIGIVTYLTNGGCNEESGRKEYHNYFSVVFGITPYAKTAQTAVGEVNSSACSIELYTYCEKTPPVCN